MAVNDTEIDFSDLNWKDPDPYDYRYIEYIIRMLNERLLAACVSTRAYLNECLNIDKNVETKLSLYNDIVKYIMCMFNDGVWLDVDFKNYSEDCRGNTYDKVFHFPRRLTSLNFSDWEMEYATFNDNTIFGMSEKLAQIHSVLSKLRYTRLSSEYAQIIGTKYERCS